MRQEEWDWPPRQRRYRRFQTFDVCESAGWNAPRVKAAMRIYVRVMFTIFKALIAVPLTLLLLASIWMLSVLVRL